jgi:hypothetical protein
MTCPQAANRRHSLQAWHVTGNILNNKSQRQYSSLQGQCKSCNTSPQKTACYETSHEALNLERFIHLTKYYQDNQTKDKRSRMYQTGTARELHPAFSCRNLWEKRLTGICRCKFEDNVKMNHMGGHAVESYSSGQGQLGRTCEHGNELQGITHCMEFHH